MLRASAPGKLFLLGEYAVLRGAPALVAAVDRRAHVTVTVSEAVSGIELDAPQLGVHGARLNLPTPGDAAVDVQRTDDPLRVVRAVLAAAAAKVASLGSALPAMHLTIDTSAFFAGADKLGLGSSAAVATALWGALLAAAGVDTDRNDRRTDWLAPLRAAHSAAQGGSGSGADVAVSLLGGVICFRSEQTPRQIELPTDLQWLPIFTGRSAATAPMVAAVVNAVENDPDARDTCQQLAAVVEEVASHPTSSRLWIDATARYHSGLSRLGEQAGVEIVSPPHAQLAALVSAAGGSYKPSGAGGGDFGLAFAQNDRVLQQVAVAARAANFQPMPMQVDRFGLLVESD